MARKIYVVNPQFAVSNSTTEIFLCYSALDWEEGLPAIFHPPCSEDTIVSLIWGDTAVEAKAKIIDNVIAHFGVGQNDIIFIGGLI